MHVASKDKKDKLINSFNNFQSVISNHCLFLLVVLDMEPRALQTQSILALDSIPVPSLIFNLVFILLSSASSGQRIRWAPVKALVCLGSFQIRRQNTRWGWGQVWSSPVSVSKASLEEAFCALWLMSEWRPIAVRTLIHSSKQNTWGSWVRQFSSLKQVTVVLV